MALQIAPETESRVRERAARDGISVDELLNRFLAPISFVPTPAEVTAKETPEATHTRVMGLLHKWQKEDGMPPLEHKPLTQLFAEWEAKDANLTSEQVEEERRFWEEYQRTRDTRGVKI